MTVAYVVLGALALAALWAALEYGRLVRAGNKVAEAWSGIDVHLKRRHDLVPKLVEAAKGHAPDERKALVRATEARRLALAATDPLEVERAEARLTAALGSVTALAERYPELRASEAFRGLQAELAAVEDEIQAARRAYNAKVRDYNARIQVFPTVLMAGLMSFSPREFFEIDLPPERAASPRPASSREGSSREGVHLAARPG